MVTARSSVTPMFAAIADATRLAILECLRLGERRVGELCSDAGGSQSLISFHLKVLRDAGLVSARKDGRSMWYALDPRGLVKLERFVRLLRGATDPAQDASKAADLETCMQYISID